MIRQIVAGDGEPRPAGHITYRAVLPTSEMPEKFRWRDMVVWAGEKVPSAPIKATPRYSLPLSVCTVTPSLFSST